MSIALAQIADQEQQVNRVGQAICHGNLADLGNLSEVAACLMPLLEALHWQGDPRMVADALPHFADDLDMDDIRQVLANLNYATQSARLALQAIDVRLLPCLFKPDNGPTMVVLEIADGFASVFNGATGKVETLPKGALKGVAYFVTARTDDGPSGALTEEAWIRPVVLRFRRHILTMFAITGLTSLLALTPPLFVMAVYDQVVGTGAVGTLISLLAGVILVLVAEASLRIVRARLLAFMGARIDLILGTAAFQQILHLPVALTERATLGAQIAQLRQFEAVRDFFSGPLGAVLLELPFTFLFIAVIAMIAGPLALVPAVLIGILLVFALAIRPTVRAGMAANNAASARRQGFLIEMITHLRDIKGCGAETTWLERHRALSAEVAMTNFKAGQVTFVIQAVAQTLMLVSGTAALGVGSLLVMNGSLSIGGLIASMALTWRVLTPIQVGFLSLPRLELIILSLKRMSTLMGLRREREPGQYSQHTRRFKGRIELTRVSLRYTSHARPALFGVNCVINPGELIAITGPSGAGKTTLLNLIANLYSPQAGAVLIDGHDIRQIDVGMLRNAVAYVHQESHMFHGTVAQNIRLANPMATTGQLKAAAKDADLLDDILTLSNGFDTRITDIAQGRLSANFTQRLVLAQAYIKDAAIYLMDEPASMLDETADRALLDKLSRLRGKATVLMVSHRPSHIALADQVIRLEDGIVTYAGPPNHSRPQEG
ncbi:MAG: peptidase domain-containing ABC transporter [Alphaproteobacteria bacterium]